MLSVGDENKYRKIRATHARSGYKYIKRVKNKYVCKSIIKQIIFDYMNNSRHNPDIMSKEDYIKYSELKSEILRNEYKYFANQLNYLRNK